MLKVAENPSFHVLRLERAGLVFQRILGLGIPRAASMQADCNVHDEGSRLWR